MTDWNAELFTKLYSKMSLALGVVPAKDKELTAMLRQQPPPRYRSVLTGPGATAAGLGAGAAGAAGDKTSPQFLLAIFNPGQYIPAGMDPETKANDRYALSVLFNAVPQFSWVYKPAAL